MASAELRIGNRLEELETVRKWVEDFGAANALSPAVLTGLLVSFDEVLSNIMKYAYRDTADHEIRLTISVRHDAIVAEIEDDGVEFDPLAAPQPQLSGSAAERAIGGLGIHFLKKLNDEVVYERRGDRNRLSFVKRLSLTA